MLILENKERNVLHLEYLVFYNQGCDFIKTEEYQLAIECFEEAIIEKTDYIKAWNNKGIALMLENDIESAREVLRQAVNFGESAVLWYNLGCLEIEDPIKVLSCFDKSLLLNPHFYQSILMRAKIYESLHIYDSALRSYFEVLSYNPNDYVILFHIANIYNECGKYKEAFSITKQALSLIPRGHPELTDKIIKTIAKLKDKI